MTQVFLRSVCCLVCVFATAFAQHAVAYQSDEDAKTGSLPFSVVLLQKELPEISGQRISDVAAKAWATPSAKGHVFEIQDLASSKKKDRGFVIKTKDAQFLVMLSPGPFVEASDIEQVTDIRSRNMLSEHRASISVSLAPGRSENDEQIPVTIFPLMTKLAAELTDANTVGVILPSEEILLPRSEKLQALMREKDPVAALRAAANVPVVNSSDDDPRMKAAVQEARRTWAEFEKAFAKKARNTESFNAKFPFPSKEQTEFMWVEVTSIKGNVVTGKLGNDPVWAKDLKLGDEVKAKVSDLADWMYLQDGEMVGGYSVKVLMEQQQEEQDTDRK